MTNPQNPRPASEEPDDSMSRLMHGPSGPLAFAALLFGALALLMFYVVLLNATPTRRTIGPHHLPSLTAVNLSFFAMMLALASLYRTRRLPHQKLTRAASLLALLLGLVGPVIYSMQALQWRAAVETVESQNLQSIVAAAQSLAAQNHGTYPPDLATLLASGKISKENLASPYSRTVPEAIPTPAATQPTTQESTAINQASDYEYVGAGLNTTMSKSLPDFDSSIIIAISSTPRGGNIVTFATADRHVHFMHLEDWEKAFAANDATREKAGLQKLAPPKIMTPEPQ